MLQAERKVGLSTLTPDADNAVVGNHIRTFSEASRRCLLFFCFFVSGERRMRKGIHGEPVADRGERLMSCITAMGTRVPG